MKYAYCEFNEDGLAGDIYVTDAPSEQVALGKFAAAGVVPAWKAKRGVLGLGLPRENGDDDETNQCALMRVVEVK